MAAILSRMENTINEEMHKVSRYHSPPDLVHYFFEFKKEFERFREFSEFPELARKVIVGFGGGFSAGKSSLLNAILGRKILPAEVDPTTTVPAFIIKGSEDAISAFNLFGKKISLSADEFVALTHDYEKEHGTPMGHILKSAHLALPEFRWENLALLDTPGYSNADDNSETESADARTARTQLNTAQFLVWLIRAEAGTIPEKDLKFLSSLRPEIPKLFILSQSDKREEEDIRDIISLIRSTLENRGIAFLDVLPFSARKKKLYPAEAITAVLDQWNTKPREVLFARNFKVLFIHFIRYLDACKLNAERSLNRLNRVLGLADDEDIRQDIEDLQQKTLLEIRQLDGEREILMGLSNTFFRELKKVGDKVGIEMPEPSEMDLLAPDGTNILELLRAYMEKEKIRPKAMEKFLIPLMQAGECGNYAFITRQEGEKFKDFLLKACA
ncbi:dynamin family protein [Desulfobotulus alkaliphilus]|uniref:Dynamin family protein n=2 Tax=Desulfobotulus alkaliphilus TaxID=622671 RepID=A0A562RVQ6_9BACT|nr:dynamin family protein [Desulfobotulus alkaliphilus]